MTRRHANHCADCSGLCDCYRRRPCHRGFSYGRGRDGHDIVRRLSGWSRIQPGIWNVTGNNGSEWTRPCAANRPIHVRTAQVQDARRALRLSSHGHLAPGALPRIGDARSGDGRWIGRRTRAASTGIEKQPCERESQKEKESLDGQLGAPRAEFQFKHEESPSSFGPVFPAQRQTALNRGCLTHTHPEKLFTSISANSANFPERTCPLSLCFPTFDPHPTTPVFSANCREASWHLRNQGSAG